MKQYSFENIHCGKEINCAEFSFQFHDSNCSEICVCYWANQKLQNETLVLRNPVIFNLIYCELTVKKVVQNILKFQRKCLIKHRQTFEGQELNSYVKNRIRVMPERKKNRHFLLLLKYCFFVFIVCSLFWEIVFTKLVDSKLTKTENYSG